jgi:hypothetical protein
MKLIQALGKHYILCSFTKFFYSFCHTFLTAKDTITNAWNEIFQNIATLIHFKHTIFNRSHLWGHNGCMWCGSYGTIPISLHFELDCQQW